MRNFDEVTKAMRPIETRAHAAAMEHRRQEREVILSLLHAAKSKAEHDFKELPKYYGTTESHKREIKASCNGKIEVLTELILKLERQE